MTKALPTLSGAKWRATHQATVDAVLGAGTRRVMSRGSDFFNRDNWAARSLVDMLVRWVRVNGTEAPSREEVEAMVNRANRVNVYEPFIQIAATPDKLPAFLRDALVGGGYHEAWHTEYSRTKSLHIDDIYEPLMALYGLVEDWSPYGQALLTWGNIIEDIRIERLGCKKYPGAPKKMEALQDLILIREDEGRETASHRGLPVNDDLNVVMGSFRDLGLGYTTMRQKQVLAAYKERSLEGWDFVTDGPLTHILDRTIALTAEDDIEHLWLAMEAVAAIVNAGHKGEKPPEEGEDEDEPGEAPAPECELCGSKNLKFAPSRSVIICKDCGHETPVEMKEGKGKGTPMEIDEDDPGADDAETTEGDDAGDGDGDDGEPTDGDPGSEKGEEADSEGDEEAEGKGSSDGDEDTEGDESESGESGESGEDAEDGESDSEGDKSGEGDGDGESGSDGSEDGSEGEDEAGKTDTYTDDRGKAGKADKDATSTDPTDGETDGGGERQAGGHSDAGNSEAPNLPADFAEKIAEAMGDGSESGLLDNNEAMSQAMNNEYDKEDCYEGEQVWRPYCPELDDVSIVKPRNSDARMRQAKKLRASVKNEIAVLRARLRTKFLSARTPKVVHGLRNGDALSTRRMVQTMTEINLGREPTRPDYKTYHKPDCSLAVAVVIDESGSMNSSRIDAARAMLAIAEPLESLGAPVLCIGPRDGRYGGGGGGGYDANGNPRFHRNSGVRIDVFKDWNEPLRRCLPRFACTRAEGSTPLSDGIQYAMQALSARSERHRIIMVVTDGCPNNSNVVRRQIRLAAEAGITVVGIGIDYGCRAVVDLFPAHVAVENVSDLPASMINVLDTIVFPRKAKKVQLDGKFGRAKRRGASV